jgi:S1-C subfamily serine protease
VRCRLGRLGTLSVVVALAASLLVPGSVLAADDVTERLKASARQALRRPGIAAPYPCDDGWSASLSDNVVLDVTPWMESGGLKRGDRFLSIGGTAVAKGGWPAALTRATPRPPLEIVVDRQGQEVRLLLSCRSSDDWWRTQRTVLEAVAAGRWDDCLDAAKRLVALAGHPFASHLRAQLQCHRARVAELRRPAPEEYWTLLHAYAGKAIEESRYRAGGPGRLSKTLTSIADALEKSGRQRLADDVRRQLASASEETGGPSTPPRPPTLSRGPEDPDRGSRPDPVTGSARAPAPGTGESPETGARPAGKRIRRRAGTAFAVRPDGTLITALHVVHDATRIEVWCPDLGRQSAAVLRTSDGADVAVLKLQRGITRSYLAFTDPQSIGLGDRVFTLGFPATRVLGPDVKFTEGVISSMSGARGDARYLQITVPVHGGSSGGPLLNEAGEVVGVVTATAAALSFLKGTGNLPQNVNWAVKASLVSHLFDPPASQPRPADRAGAIDRATGATCQVMATIGTP